MISNNKTLINKNWLFKDSEQAEFKRVMIPHTNKEVPYNYFDEKIYQFTSYYKKELFINDSDKRIFLNFEGVMTAFKLFVNDKLVGEYRGGYIPHFIEITNFTIRNKKNTLLLEVDSSEREDIPPFGYVIDYLTFGGIYRDVYLYELDQCFIENILYDYEVLEFDNLKGKIKITPRVLINNNSDEKRYCIEFCINERTFKQEVDVLKGKKWYELNPINLENIDLWDINSPSLYNCNMKLILNEDIRDCNNITVGFRDLKIDDTGLYLNGRKVKITGLNRHQSFPYVGYAMPKRVQIKDADILKDDLAVNLVRTSHYPQSPYFLQRCDEIGLLVLEEIPGWQNISEDKQWRIQVLNDVEGMIMRDYNHPSIVTWGVRINESMDDDELYSATNKLARIIDKNRKTCGVRYIENSNLLEDIYTVNDFIHDGGDIILRTREEVTGLEKPVPYLVTEFCGHIFPTKKFDQEERLIEHALRHGRVQSYAKEHDEYMGAIGWCAFDYNTHYDFGSGDRICYHGVMDMFRIPKYAAHIYKSQKDPKVEPVIEPLTWWSRGERDKGIVFPIYVCTNCDEVEVILGDNNIGRFSRTEENIDEKLKGLKYPPIKIDLLNGDWGSKWSEAEFIGYLDEKPIVSKKFCENPIVCDLDVQLDDRKLNGTEFDATRVVVKVVDQVGNVLPFSTGCINVETEGDIDVIGPKCISLIGGSIGFWIKTLGTFKDNTAKIKITSSFGINKEIKISLK